MIVTTIITSILIILLIILSVIAYRRTKVLLAAKQELTSLKEEQAEAMEQLLSTRSKVSSYLTQKAVCEESLKNLENLLTEKRAQSDSLQKEIERNTNVLENYTISLNNEMTARKQELEEIYKNLQDNLQSEYAVIANDTVKDWEKLNKTINDELNQIQKQLAQEKANVASAIRVAKETYEQSVQKDFYRLQLSESDIADIKSLKEIESRLHRPEVLNKAIYKSYYENAYTNLIGRVLGSKKITGIYKITNIENQMTYVGQAADVAERWRQHIKRGVGAETPTQNKLYPAMRKEGVENFMFQLLEECPREELDAREDFWQDFYGAKEYGYSIK